jgi:hypothetical protein
MNTSVSYAVTTLRYYPDLVTQEFVNVGVALASHETGWWGVKLAEDISEIRAVFPRAQPRALITLLRQMSVALDEHSSKHTLQFDSEIIAKDPFAYIRSIAGETVGSLRWSSDRVQGVSDSLPSELDYWFNVMVTVARPLPLVAAAASSVRESSAAYEAPNTLMRQEFEKRGIWKWLGPVTVPGKLPVTLEHCFKNDRLHVFEPISLAHARAGSVLASAERWRGRIDRLSDGPLGHFAFYGLVRLPDGGRRLEAAEAGIEIISGSRSADVRLFTEAQVDDLCLVATQVVASHDNPPGH